MTKEQALRELLSAFDRGEKDGIVTKDEFMDYYNVRPPAPATFWQDETRRVPNHDATSLLLFG
jgi:hypothetical protein